MSSRKPGRGARSTSSTLFPYLERTRGAGGQIYLYYRRRGRRVPLPGPEGSTEFAAAWHAADTRFEQRLRPETSGQSVHDAITEYLDGADYRQLAASSRSDYRRTLDRFRAQFGRLRLADLDEAWIEDLRRRADAAPIAWNALRSRMIEVVRHWRRQHPGVLAANLWEASRRLKVPRSSAHRPWPPDVLLAVMRAATPEFRALLTGYLLTAQRGGDVTHFAPDRYDAARRTLDLAQEKTDEPLRLHVTDSLARVLEAMRGRCAGRLFVTPRGRAWTTANAQETLATLRRVLRLPRYTLHGLRATGPVALKMLGFENRAIRALTGHTNDRNLELYLRGVQHYPLARAAQEALEAQFAELLNAAETGANRRRFSGTTGKAARRLRSQSPVEAANRLPTANRKPLSR
ncbi:MAG TPA: hypothetical protein VNE67_09135 [Acetobacteraceae bacterium]|nr:hypothetical protein [Acetobacteraceae bacterium]